ncbi:phosphatase PAP2 family protein [Micrococcus sp.]|uniref:phosphatase PAP2 family protein n=1 Tax=Micrococcus sp. TaxID=1271 RepID=UPI002A910A5D|nr:phosphatase PAP2 family protein [Micrococcus sp.]MDY6055207.1 phosphatase PAP2 family protein [Micrococcus sp.]
MSPDDRRTASTPAPRTRWWAAAGLAAAGVALVHLLAVVSGTGQRVEYQLFHAVEDSFGQQPGLRERILSVAPPAAALTAAAAAVACLAGLGTPAGRRRALTALTVLAGANLTTQVLKAMLPRPDLANGVPWTAGNSLPSGHMTLAVSAAAAALLLAPARLRPALAVLGAALAAFTGAAAYLAAWHRPSDMVAAALVGAAWGLAATATLPARAGRTERAVSATQASPVPAALLGGFGLLGTTTGLVLLALTLGAPATTAADPHPLAVTAGVLLSAAPAVGGLGLLLAALRRTR